MINSKLIEALNKMIIHPIIRDAIAQEVKNGNITTEDQLKQKVEEYEDEL